MAVKVATYEQLALEDPHEKWEFVDGHVRKKPPMTMEHNQRGFELAFAIRSQVSTDQYHVRCDQSRLRFAGNYFGPDVFVVPAAAARRFRGLDDTLEAYVDPVPFVAEVWSPSTGDYDVTDKLPIYQARGDAEIWLIHPFERWVRAFLREAGGSYREQRMSTGRVSLSAVPGVTIDLDELFELL